MRLTEHFFLDEFLVSSTAQRRGINNEPGFQERANVVNVLAPGMERVRFALGQPISITSGYRSDALNRAVGGSPTSEHRLGLAADFICPGFGSPREVVAHLMDRADAIGFSQLIFEGTWVHVSFPAVGQQAKGEVLTAHFGPGGTTYSRGLA